MSSNQYDTIDLDRLSDLKPEELGAIILYAVRSIALPEAVLRKLGCERMLADVDRPGLRDAALKALHEELAPELVQQASQCGATGHMIQDAVNDAFLAVSTGKFHRFDAKRGSLKSYLRGVVRNSIIDQQRKATRRAQRIEPMPEIDIEAHAPKQRGHLLEAILHLTPIRLRRFTSLLCQHYETHGDQNIASFCREHPDWSRARFQSDRDELGRSLKSHRELLLSDD